MPSSPHRAPAQFSSDVSPESRGSVTPSIDWESIDSALLRDIGIDRPGIRRSVRGRD
jgi:hypothetical protein